jgi:hypothetical protein
MLYRKRKPDWLTVGGLSGRAGEQREELSSGDRHLTTSVDTRSILSGVLSTDVIVGHSITARGSVLAVAGGNSPEPVGRDCPRPTDQRMYGAVS